MLAHGANLGSYLKRHRGMLRKRQKSGIYRLVIQIGAGEYEASCECAFDSASDKVLRFKDQRGNIAQMMTQNAPYVLQLSL